MSAAVSYTSIATVSAEAPAQSPAVVAQEPALVKEPTSAENTKDKEQTTHLPSPKQTPVPDRRVSLAPAPVPEINAWGSVSSLSETSSRSNSNIDTKHWPATSEVDLSQNNSQSNGKKTNFIKTQSEKWVPFKGAVIISQPQARKPTQKRHGKNNSNTTSNNDSSASNTKPNDKKRRNKSDKRPHQHQTQSSEKIQQRDDKPQEHVQSKEVEESGGFKPKEQSIQQTEQSHQSQTTENKEHHPRHFKANHHHHHHHHYHHPQQQQQQQQQQQLQPLNGQVPPPQFFIPQPQLQNQRPPFRQYNNNNNRRYNNRYNNGGFSRHTNPNVPYTPYQSHRHYNHPHQNNHYHPGPNFIAPSISLNRNEEPLFSIIKQIEYYFSVENLIKDVYLRKQMNDEGWLPVKIIATFKRLSILSAGDLTLVKRSIDELNCMDLLEVGEFDNNVLKVRVKENWSNWILPVEQRDPSGKDESKLVCLVPKNVTNTESNNVEGDGEIKTEVESESTESEPPTESNE